MNSIVSSILLMNNNISIRMRTLHPHNNYCKFERVRMLLLAPPPECKMAAHLLSCSVAVSLMFWLSAAAKYDGKQIYNKI